MESNEYTAYSSKIKIRWRKNKGQKGIKEDKKRVHTKAEHLHSLFRKLGSDQHF
jgi:hypothetical protein